MVVLDGDQALQVASLQRKGNRTRHSDQTTTASYAQDVEQTTGEASEKMAS